MNNKYLKIHTSKGRMIWSVTVAVIITLLMIFCGTDLLLMTGISALIILLGNTIVEIDEGKTRFLPVIAIMVSAALSLILMQYELGATFALVKFRFIALNLVLIMMMYFTVLLIVTVPSVSCIICNLLLIVISTIDYYVFEFRGTELLITDIYSLQTAMTVINGYSFIPNQKVILVWVVTAIYSVAITCIPFKTISRRRSLKAFGAFTVFSILFFSVCTHNQYSYRWGKDGTVYRGLISNLFLEIKENHVKRPKGYKTETLETEIATLLSGKNRVSAKQELPNIIVIMNESFADLNEFGQNLKTDKEVTPFLNSLKTDTVKGYAYSPVFGGNTANSEFEFLTGNTMAFMPQGSVPYLQLPNQPTFSIVRELKDLGYYCEAIHPFYPNGWNRIKVYPNLGFDLALFREEFSQENLCRGFVTDKEMYKSILKELKNSRSNAPMFIFGVTVQNHGGYIDEDFTSTIHMEGLENEYRDAEQYLTLLHMSDEAVGYLLEKLGTQNEKTVLLFFGDHFPRLSTNFYNEIYGSDLDSKNLDQQMKERKIPFFIWANYDIAEDSNIVTSINYLSGYVFRYAGIEAPYQSLLNKIAESIPVISSDCYYSVAKGGFVDLKEAEGHEKEMIDIYRKVQYNNLFDRKNHISLFR